MTERGYTALLFPAAVADAQSASICGLEYVGAFPAPTFFDETTGDVYLLQGEVTGDSTVKTFAYVRA